MLRSSANSCKASEITKINWAVTFAVKKHSQQDVMLTEYSFTVTCSHIILSACVLRRYCFSFEENALNSIAFLVSSLHALHIGWKSSQDRFYFQFWQKICNIDFNISSLNVESLQQGHKISVRSLLKATCIPTSSCIAQFQCSLNKN